MKTQHIVVCRQIALTVYKTVSEVHHRAAVRGDAGPDRDAVASGGIAEAVAGKSIQSQEGTEGCLTRPDGKAVVNSCGTRVGAHRTLCRALGPAKENNDALEPPKGYIVSGCWELKRKFRLTQLGGETMGKQEELQQDHETASASRIIRYQAALAGIPASLNQPSLTDLNDELDAQLKIEDFIVKSREANHPKFKAWGSIALSGAGIVISLAVAFASGFSVAQVWKTYSLEERKATLEERKAQAEIVLKATGGNQEET